MKFLKKCSEQYLEFNLKLLNAQKEDFMDYVKESDSLDFLLKKMKISKWVYYQLIWIKKCEPSESN